MKRLPYQFGRLTSLGAGQQHTRSTKIAPGHRAYHDIAGPRTAAGCTTHHEAGRRPVRQTKEGQQP